jgi:hypothetical protein
MGVTSPDPSDTIYIQISAAPFIKTERVRALRMKDHCQSVKEAHRNSETPHTCGFSDGLLITSGTISYNCAVRGALNPRAQDTRAGV